MWDRNDWVYKGKHGFRPEYSRENPVIPVCNDIADSLDKGIVIVAIIIDLSKGFHFIPHDRLLTKLATSGVDSRVVVWVRELLVGRTQSFRVEGNYPRKSQ